MPAYYSSRSYGAGYGTGYGTGSSSHNYASSTRSYSSSKSSSSSYRPSTSSSTGTAYSGRSTYSASTRKDYRPIVHKPSGPTGDPPRDKGSNGGVRP